MKKEKMKKIKLLNIFFILLISKKELKSQNMPITDNKFSIISGYIFKDLPYSIYLSPNSAYELINENVESKVFEYSDKKFIRIISPHIGYCQFLIKDSLTNSVTKFDLRTAQLPISPYYIHNSREYSSGSKLSKKEFLGNGAITAFTLNFDIDMRYSVKKFTLNTYVDNKLFKITSNSQIFTEEQKKIIERLNTPNMILIDEIEVKDRYGTVLYVPPLILYVE